MAFLLYTAFDIFANIPCGLKLYKICKLKAESIFDLHCNHHYRLNGSGRSFYSFEGVCHVDFVYLTFHEMIDYYREKY